ncbi:MAG: hypothetical protein M3126_02515 [Candidatus Eremiobacteraeota bacterium]|nr:hypothetical protein [Candidatus Eremiobacteraeota bacterium]
MKIVVRVSTVNRTTLKARVLERETDSQYNATGPNVELFFAEGTPVVMGSARDVVRGAVLFVDGVSTARGKADIKKIVVLTGYLKVK